MSPVGASITSGADSAERVALLRSRESVLVLELDKVRAELLCLGEPARIPPKEKAWCELDVSEAQAATFLGYHEQSWDAGEAPAVCSQRWELLGPRDKDAAENEGAYCIDIDCSRQTAGSVQPLWKVQYVSEWASLCPEF